MTGEDSITRTTLYLPTFIHSKAREAGLNISKEVTSYLETILFGENVSDLGYQLDQIRQKEQSLIIELKSIRGRRKELEALLKEHDAKLAVEHALFDKFLLQAHNHINNAVTSGLNIDVPKLSIFWRQDYFPGNGVSKETVVDVLESVKKDTFTFDDFRGLRRGCFGEG